MILPPFPPPALSGSGSWGLPTLRDSQANASPRVFKVYLLSEKRVKKRYVFKLTNLPDYKIWAEFSKILSADSLYFEQLIYGFIWSSGYDPR